MAYRLTKRTTVKIPTTKINGKVLPITGLKSNEKHLSNRKRFKKALKIKRT